MAKKKFSNWKDESRGTWGTTSDKKFQETGDLYDKLKVGCLQRIADALETIARKMPETANAKKED